MPLMIIKITKTNKTAASEHTEKFDMAGSLKGGVCCGLILFVAGNLQQHAFTFDIAAGKVGFITALYMILVPIFGLFSGKRPKSNIIIAVVLGIAGLYLLCVKKGDFSIGKGELYALACAVGFAFHILVTDHFCNRVETISLACIQFLVAGGISLICMFIFEEPKISDILGSYVQILYAGIGSCAFAFTFQILGQKYTEPAVAALLMCLESVFSVIFGRIILGDVLGKRALLGCLIMFIGVILTQIEFKSYGNNRGVVYE